MSTFQSMDLSAFLLQSLEKVKIIEPTPIQAAAVPLALEGKDVLGSAQTGTGKTFAFSIPMVEQLLKNEEASALVLAPTRELAQQVMKSVKQLTRQHPQMRTALLIGGEPIVKQFKQLERGARIIVGTPGRVIDHLMRGKLDPKQCKFLVLDETDRMLDMGFGIQLEEIIPKLPTARQTLMFSATFPKDIMKLAGRYLQSPERISMGTTSKPAENIEQSMIKVTEKEKYYQLREELDAREGSIVVFVKTKMGADRLAAKLVEQSHNAAAIHGDLHQSKRDRVIRAFRNGRRRILVATDVAARGLDIPHIQHVINYDLPQCPEDYIHRIGRTARAGASGSALCLVTPADMKKWKAIHYYIEHGKPLPAGKPSSKRPYKKKPFAKTGHPKAGQGKKRTFSKSGNGGKPTANKKRPVKPRRAPRSQKAFN